ncbi:MAG: SET domain-containing protein-lysine N-methyltransferase [Vibrionaceae bacterium]|nr:MAG: SET domain-containing protein-lysine N-methyltransferase [Vibrionaceae bacterium]
MNFKVCDSATIRDTGTAKGRGVFATRQIALNEVIEICPVVLVKWSELPESLKQVVFNWGQLTNGPAASAISLGWGSMYNHCNPANVRYTANAVSCSMVFTAARHIDVGEELTVNYNESFGDIHSTEDNWFKGRDISPI